MNPASSFYCPLDKLQAMIEKFENKSPVSGKVLKGFVFMPGSDAQGNAKAFPFPLYGDPGNNSNDILVQSFDPSIAICPYPPGYC
ncbi:MAG TPA: hypothetical protein VFN30_03180 [Chitinophagaceae bacterium]|nr:hypothetical protein [Chitinophagaceae bacterium]